MRLIVTGCGSGGTNLGIEFVRSLGHFNFFGNPEDQNFLSKLKDGKLPENAVTKLATESSSIHKTTLIDALDNFEDIKILFMFRNPVDNCLSKIMDPWRDTKLIPLNCVNVESVELENFASIEKLIDDTAHYDESIKDHFAAGAIQAVKNMYQIYFLCKSQHPDRVYEIKMEDMILDRQKVRKDFSQWIGREYDGKDPEFWAESKKPSHNTRYKGKLARNINLYKDLETSYNGCFKDHQTLVDKIVECFKGELEYMKYE